jgi:2-amino-4-hydroxy-6-hydroxymethyldihydropteridine diphosphokinase
MTRFAIALGSNQGARLDHLRQAVGEMSDLGTVVAISSLYETEPVGGPEQGRFLNAVVLLETELPADGLLSSLQSVESAHDRVRSVRWGPRTLDLDIVATDGAPVDTLDLEIPHPRAAERLFVLQPLCDVWPEAMVGEGLTAFEAMALVEGQQVQLVAADWADH